ncbi:MAG TPA: glycosyltransferase family 2 protein, partial [Methylophaga sp.]|nr:glycosyltransferase family 2 protein [Methylophaga sp.]
MENLILEHRIAQLPLTVALLTYNRAHGFLEEAVNAILNQTFTDFELVILDNGSTDDTPQV